MVSKSSGVKKVKLGSQGLEVSQQGLGCMGQSSFFYGSPKPEKEIVELLRHAINLGVTFLDTADMYGEGPQSNEIIIGKAIKGIRDKVQIATKFGCYVHENGDRSLKGDPEYVRFCCESSLKRLDIDCIDLYYQFRVDETVPIEITVGELKKLVEEGKVKYIGLSEASSADIRRAHAIHPISAVQIEWSLWSRDIEEDVVPTCRELGIGIVAHSPLGRGFFAGKNMSELGHDDFRKTHIPRLMAPNLEKNQKFFDRLAGIGKKLEKSPGQVALAWVQHRGPDVVPIPGTTKVQHLEENAGALDLILSKEELKEIEDAVPIGEVAGDRYIDLYMTFTWRHLNSAPLSSWKPNIPPLPSPKPNAPPLASWKPKA